jgi:hypothetical protein
MLDALLYPPPTTHQFSITLDHMPSRPTLDKSERFKRKREQYAANMRRISKGALLARKNRVAALNLESAMSRLIVD